MKRTLLKGILVISSFLVLTVTSYAAETETTQLSSFQPSVQLIKRPSLNLVPNLNYPTPSLDEQMGQLDATSIQPPTTSEGITSSSSDFSTPQVTPATPSTTGAEVQLHIIDVTQGESVLVSRSFYGQPYSELTIPVDPSEGKIVSVDGGQFVINDKGGLTGTYPGPNELKSITLRMAPVGPNAVQLNLSFFDEQYEPIANVPNITYYGKTGGEAKIEIPNVENYEFLYAESFNLLKNNLEDNFLYTFGEANESLNLIYKKTPSLPNEDSSEQEPEDSSGQTFEDSNTLIESNNSDGISATTTDTTSAEATEDKPNSTKELAYVGTTSSSNTPQKTDPKVTSRTLSTKKQAASPKTLPKTHAVNSTMFSLLGLITVLSVSVYSLKK